MPVNTDSEAGKKLREWLDTVLAKANLSQEALKSLGDDWGGPNTEAEKKLGPLLAKVRDAGRALKGGYGLGLTPEKFIADNGDLFSGSIANSASEAQGSSEEENLRAKYKEAIDELMKLDPNSPLAKQVSNAALSNNLSQYGSAGQMAGDVGMSAANANNQTTNALLNFDMQRKQLGLGALGQLQSNINSAADRDLQLQQLNAGVDAANYQAKLGGLQAAGAIGGGIIGGVAGGFAGGPAGAATGVGLGAQGGAGIVGMAAGNYQAKRFRPYGAGGGGLGGGYKPRNY